jgi:lysyl-tRNA synthetase class 2
MSVGRSEDVSTSESLRAALIQRARVYDHIRRFFAERGVLEVETPILSAAGNTDTQIESLHCEVRAAGQGDHRRRWLRTSPEFFHKRLLAAGAGAIFELGKVFRDGEYGARHNPEFTLLEWYRPGWDHHRLMGEVAELVQELLRAGGHPVWPQQQLSYAELFQRHAGLDPFAVSLADLHERLHAAGVLQPERLARDEALDYLRGAVIEPLLPAGQLSFVYDFPASQAALARIRPGSPAVAERFELYLGRVEVANGYHELSDAMEQRRRFDADLRQRAAQARALPPVDERLLAALQQGLPDCAGVALGVDRLLMALAGQSDLRQLLPFPFARA